MSEQKKWYAIVNPNAGGRGVMSKWDDLQKMMQDSGLDVTPVFTKHRFHAVELTVQGVRSGFRNFLSVGGDGTLNELVNGLFLQKEVPVSDFTVGAVCVGSGNDWVRMTDRIGDPLHNILSIKNGRTLRQDVVKVTYHESGVEGVRYMVNVGGVLFDADICYRCNKLKDNGKRGAMVYVKALLEAFFTTTARKLRVIVDGNVFFDGSAFSLNVSNGLYSGGGMVQNPGAVFNDGVLNVMALRKIFKPKILFHIGDLFDNSIDKVKEVSHTRGTKVVVESEKPVRVEVDGEVVGTTPVTFELLPAALNVIVGEDFPKGDQR